MIFNDYYCNDYKLYSCYFFLHLFTWSVRWHIPRWHRQIPTCHSGTPLRQIMRTPPSADELLAFWREATWWRWVLSQNRQTWIEMGLPSEGAADLPFFFSPLPCWHGMKQKRQDDHETMSPIESHESRPVLDSSSMIEHTTPSDHRDFKNRKVIVCNAMTCYEIKIQR